LRINTDDNAYDQALSEVALAMIIPKSLMIRILKLAYLAI